jgi:hypothetical protein
MNQQQPEAPQSSRERDALRRWPFAHSIYQLIQNAPKEWSLRIGIFGRWGEGKTTVLNYIEEMAIMDSCPVAKFNPWAAQDRKELWSGLSIAVEQAFNSGNPTKAMLKRGAGKVAKAGLNLAAATNVGKAIGELVGPLVQEKLSVKRSDIEKNLRDQLGDAKLIVLIDDLDRTDPKLVPHLLLGLREVLNLPQCAFVMGLDPLLVTSALVEVHPGWGKTDEFMEKIIDFPFWLPPTHGDDIRCLLDQELKDSPVKVDRHTLTEVAHLLPTNPRKLKRFLRGLWRFKAQIERHEEAETEWIFLLLIELLRAVFFKTAERLLAHKELWNELQASRFKGLIPEQGENEVIEEEKWVKIMTAVMDEERDEEESQRQVKQAEFLRIMNAMRDLIPIEKWSNLHYWSRLEDDPPIFTWKEFKALFEEWRKNPTKDTLEKLTKSHANKLETNVAIVAKDLFGTVITYREQLLGRAAESGPESELVEAVKTSDRCLSMMRMLISELQGFSGGSPFLFASDFAKMFRHFSGWAHFTNHPVYVQARAGEADVLKLAAKEALNNAKEILEELKAWDHLRGPMVKEKQVLMDRLVDELIPGVICELRDRFTRKDGINSLWGHDRHLIDKWILFRRYGGFYSEDGVEFLKAIVGRAKTEMTIHANLFQFVLMLGHALKNGLKVLGPSELHPLASDKEIIPLIWKGVVSNRLQPRVIGSLEEGRAWLIESLGSEELLPVPEWWDKASQETPG